MMRIGLWGHNGHQLTAQQLGEARDVWAYDADGELLPVNARICRTEQELLDSRADIIAVCAARRSLQHDVIRRCLDAGKHVLAEKPAATDAAQLRQLINLAETRGLLFAEMSPIYCEQPYLLIRSLMLRGEIGRVTQVLAQKSYPYAPWRPVDETVDGGLILQSAIHALRMIEHIALEKITSVSAIQSGFGSHGGNEGLIAACAITAALAGGGIASATANYWNPPSVGAWGNDELRIFGECGLMQASSLQENAWIYRMNGVERALPAAAPPSFFAQFCAAAEEHGPLPLDAEINFHPTFAALAARESARRNGVWVDC